MEVMSNAIALPRLDEAPVTATIGIPAISCFLKKLKASAVGSNSGSLEAADLREFRTIQLVDCDVSANILTKAAVALNQKKSGAIPLCA